MSLACPAVMGHCFRVYTLKRGWAQLIHNCFLENWRKNMWGGGQKGCFSLFPDVCEVILQGKPGSLCQVMA